MTFRDQEESKVVAIFSSNRSNLSKENNLMDGLPIECYKIFPADRSTAA